MKNEEQNCLGVLKSLKLNQILLFPGGYENDCLLIRQNDSSYFMVSPTQQQTRILQWMNNHLPSDNSVALQDVTSMYTVLSVAGPKSRDLMQEMTHSDMNMHPFTYKLVCC
jgi:glycine cleavage system aminomethyltransferase T